MLEYDNIKFTVPAGKRLWLLILATILCMTTGSVAVAIITSNGYTPRSMRIATVVQDVTMFILPALITAVTACRAPARFLMIDRKPGALPLMLVAATTLSAIPAMNCIVAWNAGLSLPESMTGIEEAMRAAEQRAAEITALLFGSWSTGAYILALMIVAVLAGVSEELYFRGAMQRTLSTIPLGSHIAIWGTAIIFSAVHMQFFGFVPRMLLGAYFGYLCVWSESLWLPIFAHVLNNALAATSMWHAHNSGISLDSAGTHPEQWWWAVISAATTGILIYCTKKIAAPAK